MERILSSDLSHHVGKRVRLAGWLHNQRQLSALTFIVLRDRAGIARPEDAFYVGDALDDMRMAAAAGVRGIGIVSMNTTADDLLAAGAVESAGSVVEWVDQLLSESAAGA